MIDYSRRNFLKLSLGSAIAVSLPVTLTSSRLLKQEAIEYSYTFGEKAMSYSFTTQELLTSYLAYGGIWIADLLSTFLQFITVICSIIVTAIAI